MITDKEMLFVPNNSFPYGAYNTEDDESLVPVIVLGWIVDPGRGWVTALVTTLSETARPFGIPTARMQGALSPEPVKSGRRVAS